MSEHSALIELLKKQGIKHPKILDAIKNVPRQKFIPKQDAPRAYENSALPIACQQTISQPYIVALMTQILLNHEPFPHKVLEIGTGSGYQCAILAQLFKEIWSMERLPALLESSRSTLRHLGYRNIHFQLGDGYEGWPAAAPFDGIMVTAASKDIPPSLLHQLSDGGILIIPIGLPKQIQQLTVVKKQEDNFYIEIIENVSFVPLIRNQH